QLGLLLAEVRGHDAVTEAHGPRMRLAASEERLEERGLPRAVRADEGDVLAALEREAGAPHQHTVGDGQVEAACLHDRPPAPRRLQELEPEAPRAAGEELELIGRARPIPLDARDLRQLRLRLLRLRLLVPEPPHAGA